MGWGKEESLLGAKSYEKVVKEGFIYTEGDFSSSSLGDKKNHNFGGRIPIRNINFLKVNPKAPMVITEYEGHINVTPQGDKRMPAQIWDDFRVYNRVGFIMVPYEVKSTIPKERGNTEIFSEGFENIDGSKSPLSVGYVNNGYEVDNRGITTWAAITPPQVIRQLFNWIYEGTFECLRNAEKSLGEWETIGRANIPPKEIWKFVRQTGLMLEERFEERLFPIRPREEFVI